MPGPIEDVTAGALRGMAEGFKTLVGRQAEVVRHGTKGVVQNTVSDADLAELEALQALRDKQKGK